jgi:hypothetical protein
MPLIFCDESDTARVIQRDVFVYACVRMSYSAYDAAEKSFWELKRERKIAAAHEIKWTRDRTFRASFLEILREYQAEIVYYVVADKRRFPRPKRYRRKVLEAAFRSLCVERPPCPLLLMDSRTNRQDREEAAILEYLARAQHLSVPAYAFLPSERVVGLQLADLVAGAVRAHEAGEGESGYVVIRDLVRNRVEMP